jgi:hypothetical protein
VRVALRLDLRLWSSLAARSTASLVALHTLKWDAAVPSGLLKTQIAALMVSRW